MSPPLSKKCDFFYPFRQLAEGAACREAEQQDDPERFMLEGCHHPQKPIHCQLHQSQFENLGKYTVKNPCIMY